MSITKREFGKLESGEEVSVYQIKNESGAYIEVTDYGAILRCISSGQRRKTSGCGFGIR